MSAASNIRRQSPPASPPTCDLLAVLDEELAKLPENYRAAILLCDLEGRTRKDAAARLAIPDGTLSNRLASARRMLARRLTRRGIALGAGGIATLLSQAPVAARVPAALVGTTARLAVGGAAPYVAPAVSALADGEMKMVLFTKLNAVLASMVAVLAGVALLGTVSPVAGNDQPRKRAPAFVALAEFRPVEKPADPPAPNVIDNDGPIDHVTFSRDGKYVAAQTRIIDDEADKTKYAVKVWDAKTGKLVKTVCEGKKNIHGIAFSPDSEQVATTVTKFDPTKGKPGDIRDAYSAEVLIWDVESGKQTATLTDSTAHILNHISFSPDGKYIAAGGAMLSATALPIEGERITVWDATTNKVHWETSDRNQKRKIGSTGMHTFSADSKTIATSGDDGCIRILDSFTGKELKSIDTKFEFVALSVAISPDGKSLVASGMEDMACVWDIATGDLKHTLKGGYKPGTEIVRFLTDGTLVTAGTSEKGDGNIKLWDATTGKLVKAIADPNLTVRSMDVSRDGNTIAVGTWEKSLVLIPLGK